MYVFLERIMLAVCRFSLRRPLVLLFCTLLVTIPALIEVQKITIDPNLVRLLPGNSRASTNTVALSPVTGDGGYFTMVISSEDTNRLIPAARAAAALVRPLEGVHTVEYEWPVEFFRRYRYLLVPNDYLNDICSKIVGWKSELSPAGVNLLEEDKQDSEEPSVQSAGEDRLEGDIRQFATLSRYHFSADKKNLGMIIRTTRGIDDLQGIVRLYKNLTNVASQIEQEQKVTVGIAGSHRNKVDEYDIINADLGLATLISGGLILLVTIFGFRSLRTACLVLLPLLIGMVWGFGLIPITVKSLNLITSFLMLILTGMGIDYAIHLVKRVEQELVDKALPEALLEAYRNTGPSVLVSGFTTALALFILAVSDFRGFSEFGIIAAMVISCILLAMLTVMPPAIVLGHRWGFVRARDQRSGHAPLFSYKGTLVALGVVGLGLFATVFGLKFDASFRNLAFDKSKIAGAQEARASQNKVYSSSFSPGAIYVAKDKATLDRLLDIFNQRVAEGVWLTDPKTNLVSVAETIDGVRQTRITTNIVWKTNTTTIEVVRSLRDYAPLPESEAWQERLQTLRDIQEEMREGDWISKISNQERRRWIEEMRDWKIPRTPRPAGIDEVPGLVRSSMISKDGKEYLAAVFPSIDRKSAKNAIQFTKEIYDLVPADQAARERLGIGGVRGPVGETPVFAEIVMIVKGEVFWLVGLTFVGVFVLVWLELFSVRQSLFVMIPLLTGLLLTFGLMVLLGMNLNLFNVIMIPALLGMGVDNGVHMYTRWKEYRGDSRRAASELFMPLFLCTFTTMLGYAGMLFVTHPGLRSIGWLAFLGMMMLWVTSALLLPGLLEHYLKRRLVLDSLADTDPKWATALTKKFVLATMAASVKEATPVKKVVSVKKAAPAKKTASAKKTAPAKKTASAKKTAPAKKAASVKKTAAAKKARRRK